MEPSYQCAFPIIEPQKMAGGGMIYYGLSKREWFAGMALQGILAGHGRVPQEQIATADIVAAKWAFQFADAMLEESSNV